MTQEIAPYRRGRLTRSELESLPSTITDAGANATRRFIEFFTDWNTVKIGETVERLWAEGESIDDEKLSHVSLLPFRHVMPNGTYFIEDQI